MSSEQVLIVLMFVLIVWQARLIWRSVSLDSEATKEYEAYLKVYHFDQQDLKDAFTEGFAIGYSEGSGESPLLMESEQVWQRSNSCKRAKAFARVASRVGSEFVDVIEDEKTAES